jgi:penicillin-binding protein 2
MIYRRYGIGHGPVLLADALAESCNVYFFHHADLIGSAPLVEWGRRFGFGELTGVDLPGESRGRIPAIESSPAPSTAHRPRHNGEAESLAIGQGTLTATPLQVVRMMAAIGNGGKLVTPHVVERLGLQTEASVASGDVVAGDIDIRPPQQIAGLDARKLDIVREGLRRVVADEKGTGHATISLDGVSIAGKTGTAELGDGSADHAWFAGYAPAESPRIAFVIVLEHAGDAAAAAGPVANRLVARLKSDGYFHRPGSANGP